MANKHLQLEPHKLVKNKKSIDSIWYEHSGGISAIPNGDLIVDIKWSSLRAALKRKDKK